MDEFIASLKKLLGEGKTVKDIVKAVLDDTQTQPVYQEIFQRGHAEETRASKAKFDALTEQVTGLTGQLSTAQTALTDLQSKTPDVKTVTDQFQAQIADLSAKNKAKLDTMQAKVNDTLLRRGRADLKSSLIAKGVDPDYADVLVNKEDVKLRMRPSDDGDIQVMADGKDIPLTVGEGQTPLGLLTEELSGKVPAKFLSSSSDRGSDSRSGPASGSGSVDQFKKIRDDVAARNKTASTGGIDAIAGRMGTGGAPMARTA